MNIVLLAFGVVLCMLIVVACICRVNLMRYGTSKFGWMLLYFFWAPCAGGMLLDLLTNPDRVEWWNCAGIAGIAAHIVLTRRHWSRGAPVYTERRA